MPFRKRLEQENLEAANKHLAALKEMVGRLLATGDLLKSDPQFRAEFNMMCLKLGVDPLQSRKGLWAELGEFYRELSIKVVDACRDLKNGNSGIIPIELIVKHVEASTPDVNENDIKLALNTLLPLGSFYQHIELRGKGYVKITTMELAENDNVMKVLQMADENGKIRTSGSPVERDEFETAIASLMNEGLVWIDRRTGRSRAHYYVSAMFPGFRNKIA